MTLFTEADAAEASQRPDKQPPPDGEQALVLRLIRTAIASDIQCDPLSITNLYVALKSRPQVVLAGAANTGKLALVQSLAQVLVGDNPGRCQIMIGHARWAAHSRNVAEFVEAQARLNTAKLAALIEDASRIENSSRIYIGCLARISPAELQSFFTVTGYAHPPNLLLVGTLDAKRFEWWDTELLARTTIIQWPGIQPRPGRRWPPAPTGPDNAEEFLHACIRSEQAAYAKLCDLVGSQPQALWPLFQVEHALKQHAVQLPPAAMQEAMIYLVNAWTREGRGLFDDLPAGNLQLALDFALVQHVLPWGEAEVGRSPALRRRLEHQLGARYPRAVAFVEGLP